MSVHPQYDDAYNTDRQYSRTLLLHLQKQTTIIARSEPRASIIQ